MAQQAGDPGAVSISLDAPDGAGDAPGLSIGDAIGRGGGNARAARPRRDAGKAAAAKSRPAVGATITPPRAPRPAAPKAPPKPSKAQLVAPVIATLSATAASLRGDHWALVDQEIAAIATATVPVLDTAEAAMPPTVNEQIGRWLQPLAALLGLAVVLNAVLGPRLALDRQIAATKRAQRAATAPRQPGAPRPMPPSPASPPDQQGRPAPAAADLSAALGLAVLPNS